MAELGKIGRPPNKGEEKGADGTLKRGSNSKLYILSRLDRDGHSELAAKVRAGEMFATVAALRAGYRKPAPPVGPNHLEELDLWLGIEGGTKSAFPTNELRRAAWFQHRDWITARHKADGFRCIGWWHYEAPIELPPGGENMAAALFEAGLLEEGERSRLIVRWCSEFEQGQALQGASKRAYLREAGIPRSLLREWSAERKRRARTIRDLEAASKSTAPPGDAA